MNNKGILLNPEKKTWKNLSTKLLDDIVPIKENTRDIAISEERKNIINDVFNKFKVDAKVVNYNIGHNVTRYNVELGMRSSLRTLSTLMSDIQIHLGDTPIRFSYITPGHQTSGIEIPNEEYKPLAFKEVFNNLPKKNSFAIPLGKDIDGNIKSVDLRELPHMIIGGTTGSGKSMLIRSIINSLIMRNDPDSLKLILVDPKQIEMHRYRELPHLLCPIIKTARECKQALEILGQEMEKRYMAFLDKDCSNIKEYNELADTPFPYIVMIIDEYADIVDVDKTASMPLTYLVQRSRAAGIHLIIATQRPSPNVITGVIKANMPAHIGLMTATMVESLTLLGESGAEKLLGKGDMLASSYLLSRSGLVRLQAPYVLRNETLNITNYLRENYKPNYDQRFNGEQKKVEKLLEEIKHPKIDDENAEEEKYQEVKEWTMKQEYMSISLIQRECSVGFNRACRYFLRLQKEGVVDTTPDGRKGCRVLKKLN